MRGRCKKIFFAVRVGVPFFCQVSFKIPLIRHWYYGWMKNPTNEESYGAAKEKAKKFYKEIVSVWSPALDDYVVFNSTGFRHLIWKQGKHRFKGEQKRRFALIPYAAEILKNSQKVDYRETHEGSRIIYRWVFTEEKEGITIKVIVRQIEGQRKQFLSIFEANKKSTQKE